MEDGETTWRVDAQFMTSQWTCIWDQGCAGIEAEANVAAQLGCCSVGAELLDDDEAMLISALAATLTPERAQFAAEIKAGGALRPDRRNTRVVDGACVFLNRPGFAGGAGCALHGEALANDDSPSDWKPSICWQLPLKIDRADSDGVTVATLRRWQRSDWGTDGESMAYCCTEAADGSTLPETPDAYVRETPVFVSLRHELDELMGPEAAGRLVDQLRPRSP